MASQFKLKPGQQSLVLITVTLVDWLCSQRANAGTELILARTLSFLVLVLREVGTTLDI